MISESGRVRPLFPSFAASADACVSPDAKRILFSGRQKPGDAWQIWEAPLAGAAVPRRLTRGGADAIRPVYLPTDKVAYSVNTPNGYQIELEPMDMGVEPLRLTHGPGDHIVAQALVDGRILFEAPHARAKGRDLWTVYTDGTGIETYRCDHKQDRRGARQLGSGDILFDAGGRLFRFSSARAVALPVDAPEGEFAGPAAGLSDDTVLIAYRKSQNEPYALYTWKPGAAPAKVAANAVEPVLLAARPMPKLHPTALGDRPGANLLSLSVYTSKDQKIAKGSVAAVRAWALDDGGRATAIGQTPVEADGSFYVQVPGERPIRFELLDRSGHIVAAERGWWHARRGEQRVCVGCHAGPERAPDNVPPQVLIRTQEPVKLTMRK